MRIPQAMLTAVLCAGSVVAAHAQRPITTPTRGTTGAGTVPSNISFAYDAAHGKIDATGVRLATSTIKSNSVSPTIGAINITVHIIVYSHFEAGTTYHCSVNAIGGILDLDNGTVDGAIETANTFAVGSGTSYTCSFHIPYTWTLAHDPGADSGLIIAFGAAAVNTHGEVGHSTLQVDGIENLPPSGATSNFSYTVAL
jgi:hypothetical protein